MSSRATSTTSSSVHTTYKKKLIEVALPLEEINVASAREKSIRHGHPSTLHLWWARRPLAACRAVLFASLVDDPSSDPSLSVEEADVERERLFKILRELVKWESSTDEAVLGRARAEIMRSTNNNPPPVLDPFCGGGSIPLEAQRLGLEAHGSDLNPVAVLITKALIEIPPIFAGRSPVNPVDRGGIGGGGNWPGAKGLAADVRHYGRWMRDEAEKRIGHLYPKATLPGGGEATVIAWLWARTVTCPNPACGAQMPLVRSFALSTKKGKQTWAEPVVDHAAKSVRFQVKIGVGTGPAGTVERTGARCVVCGTFVNFDHIRAEGRAKRMGVQVMAVVAEGNRGRTYLSATDADAALAASADPQNVPDSPMPEKALSFRVMVYGMTKHRDLFTPRQLVALTTFSDLVGEARARVRADARAAGLPEGDALGQGGAGAAAYADAVATYLAFVVDRAADRSSTICTWDSSPKMEALRNTYARQAIPMTWDFAEGNPFSASSGNWTNNIEWTTQALERVSPYCPGQARQADAVTLPNGHTHMVSTDPPYYDNIGYADLSDFFYVWLRRSLRSVFPDLLDTMLVPKAQELIASPYRFDGSKAKAQAFFEKGLGAFFEQMSRAQHPEFPLTVYYAFKQSESDEGENSGSVNGVAIGASTGWETMLEGLMGAGWAITGTWPIRTELSNRMIGAGTNALASSIVIACRRREIAAETATRRDLVAALRSELPDALLKLQHGNIAPVDLAQATIGPGMAVFSRFARVLEADGSPMRVRTALQLINQELDAYLTQQEGELDPETRFAVAWFEQNARRATSSGTADTLARAKNTSIDGLVRAGIASTEAGKLRLLRTEELESNWDPATDKRPTVWEATHHLIRRLMLAEGDDAGESGAADLLGRMQGDLGERAKDLAYRLYALCERKKWSEEAQAYNALVVSWPALQEQAAQVRLAVERQGTLI